MTSKDFSRVLRAVHVPWQYHHIEESDIFFSDFSQERPHLENRKRASILAKDQLATFKRIMQDIPQEDSLDAYVGMLACFTSTPTEDVAMGAACLPLIQYLATDPSQSVLVVDLGHPASQHIAESEEPRIVVVHNLTAESTYDRVQFARDVIKRFILDAFVIVAAAGTNPVNLCDNILRVRVDYCFYGIGQVEPVGPRKRVF